MIYNCKFCGKECNSKLSESCHERFCKLNPNYEQNIKKHKETSVKFGSLAGSKAKKEKAKIDPLNQFYNYKIICSKCGREFELILKVRDYQKGRYRKTCSSKCSNGRIKTEEIKNKISETLKLTTSKNLKERICKLCGKSYNLRLQGATRKFCSKEHFLEWRTNRKKYDKDYCKKMSKITKCLMKEGKIKPWLSRNIKSYAEKFFIKVLKYNKINYISEYHELKYFLDFLILTPKCKIDLEIDGKQHTYLENIEKDRIRDEILMKLGYKVYRIAWNEINTEKRQK